jgi:hypothetical protein
VSDGNGGTDTATVTITVTPVNDAPVASGELYYMMENTTLDVAAPGLLANDSDVDGDTLAVNTTPVSGPANGALTLYGDGAFEYTPTPGFNGSDSFVYEVSDGNGGADTATVDIVIEPFVLQLEAGTVTGVADGWTVVGLTNTYASPVVVCSVNPANNTLPVVVRVRNAGPMSFEVRLQNPSGTAVVGDTVHYLVVEEGVWHMPDGRAIEAACVLSDGTAYEAAWHLSKAEPYAYQQPYTNPVVLGQVMTFNDARWSHFWCCGETRDNPPTASTCYVGKAVASDPDRTRADEVVGVVVVEQGSGTVEGVPYEAILGGDIVRGVEDAPPYSYALSAFTSAPQVGLVSQAAQDGGDGAWAILYGVSPLAVSMVDLAVDEDQLGDSERAHTTEQVACFVFDCPLAHSQIGNDEPVAADDWYTTIQDQTLDVSAPGVLDNDYDADGDPLDAVLATDVSHGTLALNADGSFSYTPGGGYVGEDVFTYVANDGELDSNEATVTITVGPPNNAPVAVDDAYATDEDVQLNVAAPGVLGNDDDADGDPIVAYLVSGASNGVVVLSEDGSFTYAPDPDYAGTDGFVYIAHDGEAPSNEATVTITVNAVNDPPVAAADDYVAIEEQLLTVGAPGVLANDSDVEGEGLTAALVSDVAHGALTLNADGSFEYLPDLGYLGEDAFTYVANDGTADSNEATVTIDVHVWTADLQLEVGTVSAVGAPWQVVNLTNTYETPVVVCSVNLVNNTLPVVVRVRNVGATSFEVRLQNPSGSAIVGDDVHYVAIEEGLWDLPEGLKIEASRVVSTGTAYYGHWHVAEMEPYTYQQSYTDPVVLGQVMSYNDPRWSVFWCCGATRDVPANASVCNVGKQVSSDTDTSRADETLGVIVVEQATGAVGGVPCEAAVGFDTVQGVGDSPPYMYTLTAFSSVPEVGLVLQAAMDGGDGGWAVLYGAAPLTATTVGLAVDEDQIADTERQHTSEQVGYLVFGSAFSYSTAEDDPPTSYDDAYNVEVDQTLNVPAPGVLGNDTEPEGQPMTAALVSDVSHGTLALYSDGSFTYTPDTGYVGLDSFSYVANDGGQDGNEATVTINVTEENMPPTANDDSYSTNEDQQLVVAAPGVLANDVDTDPLTAQLVTSPSNGGVLFNTDGSFTYIPFPNYFGEDSFTYVAHDGEFPSNEATVTIMVDAVNDPPVASDDAYTTVAGATLNVEAPGVLGNDTDAEGEPLTAALASDVSHGSLVLAPDGSFQYSPDVGYWGDDVFTYVANDGTSDGNEATVTITVEPPAAEFHFEVGTVSAGDSWVPVSLTNAYSSVVVVCTVDYANNSVPVVARVRNVTSTGFEVRLQNPSGVTSAFETVHYMAMEEGVWQLPDGRKVEAARVLSDGTSRAGFWSTSAMESYAYQQSYTVPVVLGQVMSYNDTAWSAFWCCDDTSAQNPPSASACYVGKHVGQDTNQVRSNETLGVIVVEQGGGSVLSVPYQVGLGADTVLGVENAPPYTYTLSGFSSAPQVGILVQAAMDGGDGSWAVLYGAPCFSVTSVDLAVDEDQVGDAERVHTAEQVGYIVFESSMVY